MADILLVESRTQSDAVLFSLSLTKAGHRVQIGDVSQNTLDNLTLQTFDHVLVYLDDHGVNTSVQFADTIKRQHKTIHVSIACEGAIARKHNLIAHCIDNGLGFLKLSSTDAKKTQEALDHYIKVETTDYESFTVPQRMNRTRWNREQNCLTDCLPTDATHAAKTNTNDEPKLPHRGTTAHSDTARSARLTSVN